MAVIGSSGGYVITAHSYHRRKQRSTRREILFSIRKKDEFLTPEEFPFV
jgi:hypothetical protein